MWLVGATDRVRWCWRGDDQGTSRVGATNDITPIIARTLERGRGQCWLVAQSDALMARPCGWQVEAPQ